MIRTRRRPAAVDPSRAASPTRGRFQLRAPRRLGLRRVAPQLRPGAAEQETARAEHGQPAPVANDTSVILGRLDLKLFAGAEPDNAKAAIRLGSDMGEFFMPFPGIRINQQSGALQAGGMPGYCSSYEVKFTDTTKPNGQIWAGVVGTAVPNAPKANAISAGSWSGWAPPRTRSITAAAKALAESIRPYTPPPPPEPPPADPNAPVPPRRRPAGAGASARRARPGGPTPVPGMTPGQ